MWCCVPKLVDDILCGVVSPGLWMIYWVVLCPQACGRYIVWCCVPKLVDDILCGVVSPSLWMIYCVVLCPQACG